MPRKTQHVVRAPSGWSVKKGGAKRASKTFATQKEAISYGKKISKKQGAELYIHREDGMIREKNSYGKDPHPPRG
jgi:uncharacterized protein YdaT